MNKIRLAAATLCVSAAVLITGPIKGKMDIKSCYSNSISEAKVIAACSSILRDKDLPSSLRARVLFRRAYTYNEIQDPQAEIDYLAAIELKPDYSDALFNLGLIYKVQGEYSKSLPFFERAWLEGPTLHRRHTRADVYYKLERYYEALADIDVALSLNPDNLWAHRVQARSLEKLERFEEALQAFSRAILLDKDSASTARRERAWLYYRHLKLPEHAEADLRHILEQEPNNRRALSMLGYVLLRLDHYDDAKAAFERALEISPDSDYTLRGLARLEKEASESEELNMLTITPMSLEAAGAALASLRPRVERELENSPDSKTLQDTLALVQDMQGTVVGLENLGADLEDLKADLDRFADMQNDVLEEGVEQKPQNMPADISEAFGLNSEFAREIADGLNDPTYPSLRASSYAELGEADLAIAEWDAILQKNPNHVMSYRHKAEMYYDLKDYSAVTETLDEFFNAIAEYNVEPEGWHLEVSTLLGTAHYRLGDTDAALSAWSAGLELEHSKDISLWQLRLQSAGHFEGGPDGEMSEAFMTALAACSENPDCLK